MGRKELDIRYEKRGKYWYYKRKSDKSFHSTGKTSISEAVLTVEHQIPVSNIPGFLGISFYDYARKYFNTTICPHYLRLLDEGRNLAPKTIETNWLNLKNHILPSYLKNMFLSEIRRKDIIDFRSTLRAKNLAGGTINKIMSALKVIFNEAYYREEIVHNPVDKMGHVIENRVSPDIFTQEELKMLFPKDFEKVWKDRKAYTCFFLASCTGMRKSEVLALHWDQIHFEEGYISVEMAWKTADILGVPKGGKNRFVSIPDVLKQALMKLYEEQNIPDKKLLVFCYNDGRRLGTTWWTKNFLKGINNSGIDSHGRKLVPHSLRHTLNSILRSSNHNPDKIRASLGWNSEVVQNNYTHWKPTDFEEQGVEVNSIWNFYN